MLRNFGFALLLASIGFTIYRVVTLDPVEWNSLGYYKVIPWMLIVGMFFTTLGLIRSRSKQLSLLLIVFFIAFAVSLVDVQQLTVGGPGYYLWATKFTGIVTLGVIIGTGLMCRRKL